MVFNQVELALVADVFLPCALNPSGEGYRGIGGKAKAQVVGPPGRRRRVGEQPLRRRLQRYQDFGRRYFKPRANSTTCSAVMPSFFITPVAIQQCSRRCDS